MLSPLHRAVVEAAAEHPSWKQAAKAIGLGETKFRQVIHEAQLLQRLLGAKDAVERGDTINITHLSNEERLSLLFQQDNALERETVATPIEGKPRDSKPRVSIRADMPATRVLAIGDTHDSPKLPDKARFRWIARHAAATSPDRIVHIGDFGDWHSCSRHEAVGSLGYAHKPSFRQDIESLEEALHAIFREIGSDIQQDVTEGNHEGWVQSFEESHPTLEGGFYQQLQDLWARYSWRPHAYGEFLFIDGVGFVHVPKNILGKPYGGRNIENTIGNDATFSIVCGHTHRSVFKNVPKIGPAQSIEVLNLGSAMPANWIAPYAQLATTGWTYGVFDLEIRCGHITAHNFIPMTKLEQLYGD